MGGSTLALLLVLGTPAGLPELVVFPPEAEGVDSKRSIEVWAVISAQLKEDKAKLGVEFKLQDEAHDALVGPAREQAWECGANARCLSDLGQTLGADLLVSGTISKAGVSLVVIEVATKKKLTGAKSSPKLAKEASSRQAIAAAKGLIAAYVKIKPAKGGKPEPAVAEASKKPPDKGPAAKPPPPTSSIDGMIRISRAQLEGVASVTVDGAALAARDDGAMTWIGSPGSHSIVARRSDGATYSKELVVEPRSAMDLVLTFSAPEAGAAGSPAFAGAGPAEDEEAKPPAFKTWWFWTTIGAAVVAGTTSAIILSGGNKGGPAIAGEFGVVSGTY